MEAAADAVAGSSGLSSPEIIAPTPRGQKRGAPDEDEAAGDGAARGSPRRAANAVVDEEEEESSFMESEEEESYEDDDEPEVFDAPPHRPLLEFLRVHPCAAAGGSGATAGSSTTADQAQQEPVDVTLRLGMGPVADDDTVDTTLSLRLGPAPPAAAPALSEDGGGSRFLWSPMEPVDEAILLELQRYGTHCSAAAAEPAGSDDGGVEVACRVAAADPADAPPPSLPRFFGVEDYYAFDFFAVAATASDGAVGSAYDGAAGRRPSSSGVMDLHKACPSGSPDYAPDPTQVPNPAAAVDDGGDLAAHAGERPRASALSIDFVCSPERFMIPEHLPS